MGVVRAEEWTWWSTITSPVSTICGWLPFSSTEKSPKRADGVVHSNITTVNLLKFLRMISHNPQNSQQLEQNIHQFEQETPQYVRLMDDAYQRVTMSFAEEAPWVPFALDAVIHHSLATPSLLDMGSWGGLRRSLRGHLGSAHDPAAAWSSGPRRRRCLSSLRGTHRWGFSPEPPSPQMFQPSAARCPSARGTLRTSCHM